MKSMLFALACLMIMAGCVTTPVGPAPVKPSPTPVVVVPTPTPVPTPLPRIALSWENTTQPHPERMPWSDALIADIDKHFTQLDKATDISKFCAPYASLTHVQKLQVWAELFVGDAYYESAWTPTCESVDVGTKNDKGSWSVGLFQVSGNDWQNSMHYSYEQLKQPLPNIDLGVNTMALQIDKVGTVLIGPGRNMLYWSTLHPGGQYDKSASIIARVKKLPFCQTQSIKKH